jgi:DNA-binding MarR family transcriptional regulator
LIEKGFIDCRPGVEDRRQRLLFTTDQGHELALRLAEFADSALSCARSRIIRRLSGTPRASFLLAMIDPAERGRRG